MPGHCMERAPAGPSLPATAKHMNQAILDPPDQPPAEHHQVIPVYTA
jgi:hypothetical protein